MPPRLALPSGANDRLLNIFFSQLSHNGTSLVLLAHEAIDVMKKKRETGPLNLQTVKVSARVTHGRIAPFDTYSLA